jgi:hypothetical protein
MHTGIVLMPIGDTSRMREYVFIELSKTLDITYVGLKDVAYTQDINLQSNIIIANLKSYMALSKPYIYFDCDNETPQQRKLILDMSTQANYLVVGLVLDSTESSCTISVKNAPMWSEGFKNIIYSTKE